MLDGFAETRRDAVGDRVKWILEARLVWATVM